MNTLAFYALSEVAKSLPMFYSILSQTQIFYFTKFNELHKLITIYKYLVPEFQRHQYLNSNIYN